MLNIWPIIFTFLGTILFFLGVWLFRSRKRVIGLFVIAISAIQLLLAIQLSFAFKFSNEETEAILDKFRQTIEETEPSKNEQQQTIQLVAPSHICSIVQSGTIIRLAKRDVGSVRSTSEGKYQGSDVCQLFVVLNPGEKAFQGSAFVVKLEGMFGAAFIDLNVDQMKTTYELLSFYDMRQAQQEVTKRAIDNFKKQAQ